MGLRLLVIAMGLMTVPAWASASYEASVTLTNTTGQAKSGWPVILTVYRVFGGNIDNDAMDRDTFHVYDPSGDEVAHMVRVIPPAFAIGNDEIVFPVTLADGASATYRVTCDTSTGLHTTVPLVDSPHNLLPNGGFESGVGVPDGYTQISQGGVVVSHDSVERHSGERSLRLTYASGASGTFRATDAISFKSNVDYHFSFWAKSENMAYNGYGMGGALSVRFEPEALEGRRSIPVRGTRDWYCYTKVPDTRDGWGIEEMTVPAVATQASHFTFGAWQQNQVFLTGDKSGSVWLDDVLLFEQPVVTVDRSATLCATASSGAVVFARPVSMPRVGVSAHEQTDMITAAAMREERRRIRFGLHACQNLGAVSVSVSDLAGPSGVIPSASMLLETYDYYVTPYAVRSLGAGDRAEYLLSIDIPAEQPAETYTGTIAISNSSGPIGTIVLNVEVLGFTAPSMNRYMVGGIYNIGMGLDRDNAFYAEYGKARLNYLMLFDYCFAHMLGGEADLAGAHSQLTAMRDIGHVTDYVGLYREPNISEDQPRKWYQMASGEPNYQGSYATGETDVAYRTGYQNLAQSADDYTRDHGLQRLIYMVTDEPSNSRDKDPSLGWLNERLPAAITVADAQWNDMLDTWGHYNLPIFDDPMDWTGPLVYDYARSIKGRFGFCGTGWPFHVSRYQPGLMLAASGGCYWHYWHTRGPFEPDGDRVKRLENVPSMAEGFNDLRYFVMLTDLIDACEAVGTAAAVSAAEDAQGYLDGVFAFTVADHDSHVMPHNKVPWYWGYDRFYDEWRGQMQTHIGACLSTLAPRKHFRNVVTGDWHDNASWSTTSGGLADTTSPGPGDTVIFDAGSGTCVPSADVSCERLLVMGGVLDVAGYDLVVSTPIHMSAGTLRVRGDEAISEVTLGSDSTVEFYDATVVASVDQLATTFGNVTFAAGKTHLFAANGTVGSYTISGAGSSTSDAADVQDNTMFDNGPDDTFKRTDDGYRHNEDMYVTRNAAQSQWRYGLVRFDLASIPGNANITSATLKMYCESGAGSVTTYPVNEPWDYRYVCYNYRDQSGGVWWNAFDKPFDPTPGITDDFDAGDSVTNAAVASGQYNLWDVTDIVSQWHSGTRENHGLVLIGDSDGNALTFNTCNHPDPACRPQLVIESGQPGQIITVTGELGSTGSCADRAVLRSSTPGTAWRLDLEGASTLNSTHQVDVADCDASPGVPITAYRSAGVAKGNTNWVFGTDVIGDLDFDGRVDLDDLDLFVNAMNGPAVSPGNCGADLDGDADCDLGDFIIFVTTFTGSP